MLEVSVVIKHVRLAIYDMHAGQMVGGAGGVGGRCSDESQDSSPKTYPKGFKPSSPKYSRAKT